MNKQVKKDKAGNITGRGIEWTDYTSNPMSGCLHGCRWEMPDGTTAICYAEDVANGIAQKAYPLGFEHYYWNPKEMDKWAGLPAGSKVFVGSMSDIFGAWVPEEHLKEMLGRMSDLPHVTFQLLTKNPARATQFSLPPNAWIGASTPPSTFMGKALTPQQRQRMMIRTMTALASIRQAGSVTWISAEPLNIDVGAYLNSRYMRLVFVETATYETPIDWMVIGAASNGARYYPPDVALFNHAVGMADIEGVKVFYKGNLHSLPQAAANWREEFPDAVA